MSPQLKISTPTINQKILGKFRISRLKPFTAAESYRTGFLPVLLQFGDGHKEQKVIETRISPSWSRPVAVLLSDGKGTLPRKIPGKQKKTFSTLKSLLKSIKTGSDLHLEGM